MLFANSSMLRGSTYELYLPPASSKQPSFDVITGMPQFKASKMGIPKPSKIEG